MKKRFYNFGGYRLDTHNQRLLRDGEVLALTPKEFAVLLMLVENAGDLVGKDALLATVWKDVFVNEETLTRNVSWLRKKLGDGENLIETVPKRGYCFTAEVTMSDAPQIIVEEQTLTRIHIEETLTLPDGIEDVIAALPAVPPSPRLPVSLSFLLLFGVLSLGTIGFLVYQHYFQRAKARILFAANVTPFSGSVGRENTPAFSPDGKQLAFSWNGERADSDIYIQLLGVGEPIRLTNSELDEQYPVFSPDGSHIAFVRDLKTHGEVILIPALGGAERRVTRLFSGFASISFAPDGKTLAVVDTPDSAPGKPHAIHLVDLQTGGHRRLTAPAEFAGETTPRFAPDGKHLAFVRVGGANKQDLFIVPTNGDRGNEPRQVTFDRAVIHSLAWSADGEDIFFVSPRGSNRANVWRLVATGGEPELMATGGRDITNLAASPDGKTFAFVENTLQTDIWQWAAFQSPPSRFIASTYSEDYPQFSPDGARVVFRSNRSGRNEAWLADAHGKNLRQLTNSRYAVGSARFSPDGTHIVYEGRADENSDIFVVAIEGGAARRLTTDAGRDFLPEWSADGKWIYFNSNRTGAEQLWRTPADGSGTAEQITRHGALKPAPTPDGKWIYYSKDFNSAGLWRVSASGSAETTDEQVVAELVEAGFRHAWTLTKTGIFFVAQAAQDKIKFYDFATHQIRVLTTTSQTSLLDASGLSASADGKTILYAQYDQNASSIMLAELSK